MREAEFIGETTDQRTPCCGQVGRPCNAPGEVTCPTCKVRLFSRVCRVWLKGGAFADSVEWFAVPIATFGGAQ